MKALDFLNRVPSNARTSYGKSRGGLHTIKLSLPELASDAQNDQAEVTELHDNAMQQARRSTLHAGKVIAGMSCVQHTAYHSWKAICTYTCQSYLWRTSKAA